MKVKGAVLHTKLVPPRVKQTILRRPSLMKKMKQFLHFPLILLHSGPGYGKSTALSSFLHDEPVESCWYSITEHDDDILPFLTYMIYALRVHYPSFGEELLEQILHGNRYIPEEEILYLSTEYVNELMRIEKQIIFVLDDYHLVLHSESINKWLTWFIQHIPENIHLVISSRTRPCWEILTSMKLRGKLLELTEIDLALKEEEIEVLFSDFYQYPLNENEVRQVFQKTEGWIIAVQMVWQQLVAKGNLASLLTSDTASMEDLFKFLATEVLLKQPGDIQRFLEQSGIFEEMTPELCDYVLERSDSAQILDRLSQQNLFLLPLADKQYRYHALFKDFLQQRLKQNVDQYERLHRNAAEYYRGKNLFHQAMVHYRAIRDYDALAEILQHYGRTMILNGQLENLLDLLNEVPEAVKDFYYTLWAYEGEIYRYRCLYDKSMSCYQKAEKLANQHEDSLGESAGLEGQARIYLDTIQPGQAERFLLRAIDLLEHSSNASEEHLTRLYSMLAENLLNSGRASEATKWYERCKILNPNFHETQLEARLHLRTGRLHHARKILEQTLEMEGSHKTKHLPRSHRETVVLLSLIHSMMGEPEQAKKLAEAGIMEGIKYKAPFVEACGWMRIGHAAQLMSKYDKEMAIHCYKTALEIMEQLHVSRGKAEPLMGLSLLYAREGAAKMALYYGQLALEETERVNDYWLSSLIRLSMGISALYDEEWEEASRLLDECIEAFTQCGDSYGLTITLLWVAYMCHARGEWEDFNQHMGRMLEMMQMYEYDFIFQRQTLFGPRDVQTLTPLLLEAQKRQIHSNYVTYLLTKMGLENVTSHPGYTLRVQTLGEFNVWLGDRLLEDKDWHRGKAKELFQLFLTKRHQFIPKEEIIDLLWGDLDEKAATRDFKVALNALNNALEPNREVRANPFFIQRHGSSYGLNVSTGLEIDAVQFERWIHAGLEEEDTERARIYLQRGLDLYGGDYLPDRRYEDWCVKERERLQVLFLLGAERMAQLSVRVEEYERAIQWCERILQADPCWEEAYRLLMYCYYRKNNRPQALKWYRRCCEKLKNELGVEPMTSTRQMYDLIMGTHRIQAKKM